jgi:hypothetical protein
MTEAEKQIARECRAQRERKCISCKQRLGDYCMMWKSKKIPKERGEDDKM